MNDSENLIGKTGFKNIDIYHKLSERLAGVYIFDVEHNLIIPFKSAIYQDQFTEEKELKWDANIENIIEKLMTTPYRAAAKIILSRDYFSKKFVSPDVNFEYLFETFNHRWINIHMTGLAFKEDKCTSAMITMVDVTESKNRAMQMERQFMSVKNNIEDLNPLFVLLAKNTLFQVIKLDTVSETTSRIIFENNQISERPVHSWENSISMLLKSVKEEDVEKIKEFYKMENLKSVATTGRKSIIFQSNIRTGKEYKWFQTIATALADEPTTAFVFSMDISDTMEQIQQVFNK